MFREEDRRQRGLYTVAELNRYAKERHIVPATVLWGPNVRLTEDAFRSGGKNNPAVNFLRWTDIGIRNREGRLAEADLDSQTIDVGQGISMFIKKNIIPGTTWLGPGPMTKSQEKDLKQDHVAVRERFWWSLDKEQVLPVGLMLVFDGEPAGHCTLTVERRMSVRMFLDLVSKLRFTPMGSDLFGVRK